MDPVPYEITEEDIDEVLNAYRTDWPEDEREQALRHVLRNVLEVDEIVRSAPEEPAARGQQPAGRAGPTSARPGDREPQRREMALGAIEDVLIRDGFIEPDPGSKRVFPALPGREDRGPTS